MNGAQVTRIEKRDVRRARLRRELAELVELELLAEWARRMEARQARLEVLAEAEQRCPQLISLTG